MSMDRIELWEAHRGGGGFELPESTPVGFEYAWMLGGIPEADVNGTRDGVLMSLHDGKLKRTLRRSDPAGDQPIAALDCAEVRRHDVGSDRYPDQVVPTIDELLEKLRSDSRKEIVIDYKNAPLPQLAGLIAFAGVEQQVTFATSNEEIALEFRALLPAVRIKIWLGGPPERIRSRFEALARQNFRGFEQVQLHLNDWPELRDPAAGWRYQLEPDFIRSALQSCNSQGVLLQALPWQFEREDLFAILDLGVRSFAVDYPGRFCLLAAEYFALRSWPGCR